MQDFSETFLVPVDSAIVGPTGDGAEALVDAEDIAAVVATLADRQSRIRPEYAPTGPDALTVSEAASIIAGVTARPVRHVDVDRPLLGGGSDRFRGTRRVRRNAPTAHLDHRLGSRFSSQQRHRKSDRTLPTNFADFAHRTAAVWNRDCQRTTRAVLHAQHGQQSLAKSPRPATELGILLLQKRAHSSLEPKISSGEVARSQRSGPTRLYRGPCALRPIPISRRLSGGPYARMCRSGRRRDGRGGGARRRPGGAASRLPKRLPQGPSKQSRWSIWCHPVHGTICYQLLRSTGRHWRAPERTTKRRLRG
jgi:hypothetical protein